MVIIYIYVYIIWKTKQRCHYMVMMAITTITKLGYLAELASRVFMVTI